MDFEIKKCHPRPRSEKVELSSDIAYRYQMETPNMDEILKKDLEQLKSMQQPELVNKQLQMLHNEFKTETENKPESDNDFYMTESHMLGLITEENVNEVSSGHSCFELICVHYYFYWLHKVSI